MAKQEINLLDTLTAHESAVFDLVYAGVSRADIAKALNVSESTVKYHLAHIYQKLDVSSRADAVVYAATWGKTLTSAPVQAQTQAKAWSEKQIREAAAELIKQGLADRKAVNAIVTDLLLALEGKL